MIAPPRLYAILDTSCFSGTDDLFGAAEQLASAGVTLIQYRNKSGSARVMLEQARELKRRLDAWSGGRHRPPTSSISTPMTGTSGVPQASGAPLPLRLIMNDRADLCLAADFDGVHVGQDDLSPESVRKIIGPNRWLGVSTHNPEQLGKPT